MPIKAILIANRGEIAIRIARAAAELDIRTVAVYSADDSHALHTKVTDEVVRLDGTGAAAYLDGKEILKAAKAMVCDAIHPGYGFLSENADFARLCAQSERIFIGPSAEQLDLFGNKTAARKLARQCEIPLLPGISHASSLQEAQAFFEALGPDAAVMIKAVAGGGGRGMRAVRHPADLEEVFQRCRSESLKAFGNGDLYVEQLIERPRHIEIQVIGDGHQMIHLGERDCTLQRRHQKVIEVAPGPVMSRTLRDRLSHAALRMARKTGYRSLGTFEFLIDSDSPEENYFFLEANPRLQVEHTVTEEITGVDLVRAQIEIAAGRSLADLGLLSAIQTQGCAVQVRINAEAMAADGSTIPQAGVLDVYQVPSGKGIRVDGCGYYGYATNPAFDSLLAKLIVTAPDYQTAIEKAYRALSEFRIEGVLTNISFLQTLLRRPEVIAGDYQTGFIAAHAAELAAAGEAHPARYFGDRVAASGPSAAAPSPAVPDGTVPIISTMQGCIVSIDVRKGDAVNTGQKLAVIEAMKMEHVIAAHQSGYIFDICIHESDAVAKGTLLFIIEAAEVAADERKAAQAVDPDAIRSDLAEVIERHAFTQDDLRPEAVAKRRQKNRRTARENVEDLCAPDSFIEYGALVIAGQRRRRTLDDLIRNTPADGLIAGIGLVNADRFDDETARCMILAYDFTVLAGTQGLMSHKKMDRMLRLANDWRLPTVLFAEGGGGRPGDTDMDVVAGLDLTTFSRFAGLSGVAPLIGIVEGPCFAGNAALLGCCDVIIATQNSNIGMGGPSMIEGGGLGAVQVAEIGPIQVQTANGVVDLAVADAAQAVAAAQKYLSYFQGSVAQWEAADQRLLRWLVPENRLRVYDVREVITTLADADSVLEVRRAFGPGMITAFIRIEGRPFGVIANNCAHMSGAIEAEDADKAARFMQLCDAHGLPILSLCDTPGFMVGPEIEARAQVRHASRMFVVGAKLQVPFFTIVLRKGYGLGVMAMSGGGFHEAFFSAAWPSGEFGGMGLEGAVKHGFKKELAAIDDEAQREATYKSLVAEAYARGKAINMATYMEIDAVIDPAETRRWILRGVRSVPAATSAKNGHRFVDPW